MNEEQQKKVERIRTHLAALHKKWQEDPECDGHCKMSEGSVTVSLCYPNWFDAGSDVEDYLSAKPEVRVSVYSYLFGPSRMHDFNSVDEALEAVLKW